MAETQNPRLRNDIELVQATGPDGIPMIVVRDPFELSDGGSVVMHNEALNILVLLDGSRSIEEIRLELLARTARAGQFTPVPTKLLESFLDQLDQAYLLDNQRYRQARSCLVEKFTKLKMHPSVLAGRAYPEEKTDMVKFLDDILEEKPEKALPPELEGKKIPALVAPHIEIRTGRKIYAAAYGAIRGLSYDRVVILGVGHSMDTGIFSITEKNFLTPLGKAETDRQAVKKFRRAAGSLAAPNDFAHRSEHSIEFQLVFLQHVLKSPFTIVPVLCGTLYHHLVQGEKRRPREIEELVPVLDYLAGLLKDRRKKTLIVAGVDFSHVGPKFGDQQPATMIASESTSHDKVLLGALAGRDVEAFCAEARRVKDRYHVCGFSVLAMLLEVLPKRIKCVDLGHHIWQEAPTRSAVSYAAAAFYTP